METTQLPELPEDLMSRTGSFLTTVSIATTLWARYIIPDLTLDNLNMLLKQLKTGTGVIVVVNVSQTTLIISRSIIQRVEEVIRSGSKPGEISYRFVPIWAVDGSS